MLESFSMKWAFQNEAIGGEKNRKQEASLYMG
jgi:hypothetical protein